MGGSLSSASDGSREEDYPTCLEHMYPTSNTAAVRRTDRRAKEQPKTEMFRQILHIDMDAFFVSVEELEDPSLKGKAVIVGADPDGRGVVAAASYEARKFGVHSAQPIQQAKRLCPHAVFLRGSHDKYRSYSQKIYGIFKEFTPIVEMMSIDEAYLNLTGCDRLHGSGFRAADQLIRTVKQR